MGVVWAATQLSLNRPVALKIIRHELGANRDFRERFVTESQLAASVEDPHVVPIHDAGEADGVLYMTMSLIEGTDLRTLLHDGEGLAPQDAVAVLGAVASGLAAVHAVGLIHRDVKPANVLLRSRDNRAMLVDFGLARSIDTSRLTQTGLVIGTLDYMAPEQIEGKRVDERADVYSLGAVLFEMLTGKPPFIRENIPALMNAHLNDPPPRISELEPKLAPFDEVIRDALAKDPAERPATPDELYRRAEAALGQPSTMTEGFRTAITTQSEAAVQTRIHRRRPAPEHRLSGNTAPPDKPGVEATQPESHRRWVIGALAAVAGLAVVALAAVALLPGDSAPGNTTVTAPAIPIQTVTQERTVTTEAPAESESAPAPDSASRFLNCDENIRAKEGTTTCPFALNTFFEYWRNGYPTTQSVWSPAAQQYFSMRCDSDSLMVTCKSQSGAQVKFPVSAVDEYTLELAEAYRESAELGPGD